MARGNTAEPAAEAVAAGNMAERAAVGSTAAEPEVPPLEAAVEADSRAEPTEAVAAGAARHQRRRLWQRSRDNPNRLGELRARTAGKST